MTDAPARVIPRPAFLDAPAVATVLAALPGSRAVGGCVRDALARRDIADVDIAAPLPPEEIATRLRDAGLKVFETGLSHGTVTAVLDRMPVEVTALRRDVLTDGRHATVAWTTDWREDAARRDFTINAMSLAPDGALFDYFTGREDLAAGRVRFVGDPDTRLAEDYLRALRYFRFQARYGVGAPDAAAVAAIRRAVPGLARLSAERVWMELKRILSVPDPVAAVGLMAETGVLGAVLPEAGDLTVLSRLIAIGAPAEPMLRFAALLPVMPHAQARAIADRFLPVVGEPEAAALAQRLRFSGEERGTLMWLLGFSNQRPPTPDWEEGRLRAWMVSKDVNFLILELWLAEARDGLNRDELRHFVRVTPPPVFPLLGRDLLHVGVLPGPKVGQLLDDLRDWWADGGCTATRDECLAELARRIAAAGPGAAPASGRGKPAASGTGGGGGTALGG